jgi:AraC-like DNA-binding protein
MMERFAFDTREVKHTDAISYWGDEVLPLLDAELVGADRRDFSCRIAGRRVRGLACADVELSSYSGFWYENARFIGASDSLRIYRVEAGLVTLTTKGGEEYRIGPGGSLVLGPEAVTHYSIAPVPGGGTAMVGDMTTVPLQRLEQYGRFLARDLVQPLPRTASGSIVETYVNALRAAETPEQEFMDLVRNFTELVAIALGNCPGVLDSQLHDDVYYRAAAYMREHHGSAGLKVAAIARAVGVSERALFAAFDSKELSPHKYLNRIRVETAKSLLSGSDTRAGIMSIALRCGFDNLSTFNRQFRAHTGMAPTEYSAQTELPSDG